jgi:hypothetical protein
MEGTPRENRTYYRWAARTMVPNSPALSGHPKNVYLREAAVMELLNAWLAEVFAPENRHRTVEALVASEGGAVETGAPDAARRRLEAAESKLRRLRAAIEVGVDPGALVEAINEAQAQRTAARAELDGARAPNLLESAEMYAMIDSLGDMGRELNRAEPEKLQKLYEALDLEMVYQHEKRAVDVSIRPTGVVGVWNGRWR